MTPTSTATERTAVFAGSFRPFTAGHADIVERALVIFDRVIVAIGVNIAKEGAAREAEATAATIAGLYAACPAVSVEIYSGLTADFARSRGACALVRGVRSVRDFDYERDMADLNRRISGIETVLMTSRPELSAVSSSAVRELQAFGADISSFLPKPYKPE